MHQVFYIITTAILAYFFLINSLYILFIILSMLGIYNYRNVTAFVNYKKMFQLPQVKPISIIAPAFNEEKSILESIDSLLSMQYPQFEVIVVNDGSTDATLDLIMNAFSMKQTQRVFRRVIKSEPIRGIYASNTYPNLILVDKKNGGKADALNAGLNIAQFPLFCAIDSDSVLDKDALLKMTRPFLEKPDTTMAAGGIIRLSNGCRVESGQVVSVSMPRNSLARFQIIEYFRAFLGGRLGLSMLKSALIISGAFGVFRKDIALDCGGYRTNTIGEDMDLVIRMKRYLHEKNVPFNMPFIPDPICWTEAPESLKTLSRQRNRWHRGLIEVIVYNRRILFNPKYGVTGLFALPFYLVFEMLGPFVEFTGYVIFLASVAAGRINSSFAILFFLFALVLGIILSLLSILLEEFSERRYPKLKDVMIIIVYAILENFLYRQYLAGIRFKAYFDYLSGNAGWGEMERKGFKNRAE